MKSFGASEKVINLIDQCISTASEAILLNGSTLKNFRPARGLRQGDPFSPYLFIIASEVLSRLLLKEEWLGKFNGISLGPNVPTISHLMFTDDTIIFVLQRKKR